MQNLKFTAIYLHIHTPKPTRMLSNRSSWRLHMTTKAAYCYQGIYLTPCMNQDTSGLVCDILLRTPRPCYTVFCTSNCCVFVNKFRSSTSKSFAPNSWMQIYVLISYEWCSQTTSLVKVLCKSIHNFVIQIEGKKKTPIQSHNLLGRNNNKECQGNMVSAAVMPLNFITVKQSICGWSEDLFMINEGEMISEDDSKCCICTLQLFCVNLCRVCALDPE